MRARSLARCFVMRLGCLYLTVAPTTLQLFEKPCVECPCYLCLNNRKAPKRHLKSEQSVHSTLPPCTYNAPITTSACTAGHFYLTRSVPLSYIGKGYTRRNLFLCALPLGRVDRRWQLSCFYLYIQCSHKYKRAMCWPVHIK